MVNPAIILFVGLSFACTGQGLKKSDAKSELNQFQGTWQVTSLEEGGEKAPDAVVTQMKFVFEDLKLTIFAGDTVLMQGTVKLNTEAKPKGLDFASTAGRLKGQTVQCIYELDGDAFRICFGKPGGSRPTEFKSEKDQPLVGCKRRKG